VRAQTQINTIKVVVKYRIILLVEPLKRKTLITTLNSKILAYSAIKINANPTLPYSILNPETSSDSPSAKSNGVRFVSAKEEIKNIITIGINIITLLQIVFKNEILSKFISIHKHKKNNKISANLTSYDTVWAIPRRLPIRAYFLFEDQPLIITGNTFILIIIYKNNTPRLKLKLISAKGKNKYVSITIISAIMGATKNCFGFEEEGHSISLENNLIASLNGCKIPTNLTLLGPLRIWLRPKIFRSSKVINATFTRTGITTIK